MARGLIRPTVEEMSAAVARVPAMSGAVRAVMAACDDLDTDSRDVARLVLSDQGLTANLLKLANSAAYGHRRRVTTVSEAVVIMGLSAVKSLAISAHTAQLLDRALPGYALRRGELWRHSLSVGFVCRALWRGDGAAAEEAFVAGLLHDVGKVVLADALGDQFDELIRVAEGGRIPLHDGERELLGFDHAELGARIATAWGFPDTLVSAIGLHHDRAEDAPALAHCVAVADTACHALAVAVEPADIPALIDESSLMALGIGADELTETVTALAPALATDPLAE